MCGDARNWDEDAYRESILKEREIQTRTVFRTVWAPSLSPNPNPNPETIVAASSDGSIASYSISSCISKLVSSLYLFIYLFFVSRHFSRIQSNFASNLIDILFSFFFPSPTLFVLTESVFWKMILFLHATLKISKNTFFVVWSTQKIINISWYSK